jgi:lipopolysaccharide/colanic/teichoic acid biosynthesis glycosyltransferase
MVRTENIVVNEKVYAWRRVTSTTEKKPASQDHSYLYIGTEFKAALELHEGFNITHFVFSFAEALKLLARLHKTGKLPSLVLIDGIFEVQDVKNFLSTLRELNDVKQIPVLADVKNYRKEYIAQLAQLPGLTDMVAITDCGTLAAKAVFYNKLQKTEAELQHKVTTSPDWYTVLKTSSIRVFDVTFSAICISLLSPLMFILALLVKLEGGNSIFEFTTERGLRYRNFRYIRFRTELSYANQQIGDLCHINQYHLSDQDSPAFQMRGSQPGKIGTFLRATHLDELPALFNVLSGDISFISNR